MTKLLTVLAALVVFLALQVMGALFGGAFDHLLIGNGVSPRVGLAVFAILCGLFGLSFADSAFSTLGAVFTARAEGRKRRLEEFKLRRAQEQRRSAAQPGFQQSTANTRSYYASSGHAPYNYSAPMRGTHAPLTREGQTRPAAVEYETNY